jgi:hypothetical protein
MFAAEYVHLICSCDVFTIATAVCIDTILQQHHWLNVPIALVGVLLMSYLLCLPCSLSLKLIATTKENTTLQLPCYAL